MEKSGNTLLVLLIVVIGGAGLYFLAKQIRAGGAGGGGGMFSQVGGAVRGAMGMSQEVTERSVETGQTLATGIGSIATTASGSISTVAKDLTPDIGSWMPWNW
jgi:hypothetical protein